MQALQSLVQAAWSVRDRLSMDTWRIIGNIDDERESLRASPPKHLYDALDGLDALVTALVAFAGLTVENVVHNRGWLFLEIGRRLERAVTTANLLRSTVVPALGNDQEAAIIDSVLGATDSLIAYRRMQQAGRRMDVLLDLVLLDEANPRAVAYQLARLEELLERLPRDPVSTRRSPEERLVLEGLTALRLAEVKDLSAVDENSARRTALDQLLNGIVRLLPSASDAISAAYFRLDEQVHQLVDLQR